MPPRSGGGVLRNCALGRSGVERGTGRDRVGGIRRVGCGDAWGWQETCLYGFRGKLATASCRSQKRTPDRFGVLEKMRRRWDLAYGGACSTAAFTALGRSSSGGCRLRALGQVHSSQGLTQAGRKRRRPSMESLQSGWRAIMAGRLRLGSDRSGSGSPPSWMTSRFESE